MGFMDKIRNFFGKTHEESSTQARANDAYKKRMLAEEIVDLVGKIKKLIVLIVVLTVFHMFLVTNYSKEI